MLVPLWGHKVQVGTIMESKRPAAKGLTSWLLFVMFIVFLVITSTCGMLSDCIVS